MSRYISHPLIRKDMIEQRLYQLSVASSALKSSCLAVLPTGLGKTIVALMVIAARLNDLGGKVLILSPTKPLVEQHSDFFRQALPGCTVATFTGSIPPEKRAELWKDSQVIVSTPQVIENDLRARRIDLRDVVHITFDEAHRAVGRYAYVYIAKRYFEDVGAGAGADVDAGADAKSRLVLGITASPGSNPETIADVCENLHIECVEVKSETDSDVIPYLHDRDIEWVRVDIPSGIKELKQVLEKVLLESCSKLADLGFDVSPDSSKRELLDLQSKLHAQVAEGGDRDTFSAISVLAEIFKISHAIELGETQGVEALLRYFERLNVEARSKSGSKAAKRLAMDPNMRAAIAMLSACDEEHPKLDAVRRIVADQLRGNLDSRVIVFTNFRDSAEMVTKALSGVDGVSAVRFVGQASKYNDKGLTQKQQTEIIGKFKSGEYNTLVATSVAEEGLDIPSTDLVLFYEPVPSEIRTIQRKGRTGRKRAGKIVVLIAKGSRDEAAYWISARKETKMLATIANMSGSRSKSKSVSMSMSRPIKDPAIEQKQLAEFSGEGLVAYIDHREIRSGVSQIIEAAGVEVAMRTLEIGDYLLSDRVCVERKTTSDFISSLISGRRELFGQISDLARTFNKPVLIIEGSDLYGQRQIHPNAVRGALTAIAIDFGVPILMSKDATDTALMIAAIARREQQDHGREVVMHGKRSAMMLPQQQEYVVSAISNIGPVVAKNLLKHFGTVAAVMSASREELMTVELVGPKTADRIREVVGEAYKG
uniref:ATP-dependent RNA helicase SrmB n=1 Tax=Candidatus Methanogaster sp. ANME-2c ERB4 TaxID=2759911 RepID=A0A7G9YKB8_9EURY|nr:ATP-dependent RNA helicase SrmB [Methanosarcinales archaeon ANME-2c ERB4]